MHNAELDEAQAEIKTTGRSINNLRYAGYAYHPYAYLRYAYQPYGRKWKGTKEPLDESERGE